MAERFGRGNRRFHVNKTSDKRANQERIRLSRCEGIAALITCLIPVLGGFGIPVGILGHYAWTHFDVSNTGRLFEALLTSVSLAVIAATLAAVIGLLLAYSLRIHKNRFTRVTVRLASLGYAVPGTLIALGAFLPLAMFDNQVDAFFRSFLGISTGLLITGTGAVMIYAYLVRFMAISEGTLDNAFSRIWP